MASYESDNDSTSAPESSRSWKSSSNLSLISLSRRSSFSSSTSAATGLVPTKPHKANHAAWEAITRLRREKGGRVGLEHFRLLRRVGSGDIGSVYLCQIRNPAVGAPPCFYAMKVVDREALAARKKLVRAEVEKEILAMLDHPFLPTLYAEFEASHYSCLVMEFCPGGDLFGLRLRQPSRTFPVSSAKFYAAETLLALEYLHMMGIVYRDLKPENVLVREDGHIMLTDFDLSLKCDVVPKLLKPKLPPNIERSYSPRCSTPSCSTPLRPVLSCFLSNYSMSNPACTPRRTTTIREQANPNDEEEAATEQEEDQGRSGFNTELVAEPLDARSKSFVGTHEYLAPEVISGHGHGSAVDWWTLGVFLYEMLYGRTPFKGENNEKTLVNILKQPVLFPRLHSSSAREYEEIVRVQDLISKLLVKNPKKRIGSLKGSVEIKRHEFFKGVNWALIRSAKPPMVPREVHNNRIRTNNVAKALTKKERDQPYQIPHHFDYF